jgi:hypothetical protein
MTLRLGTLAPSALYLGDQPVTAAYLGSVQVYSPGTITPPSTIIGVASGDSTVASWLGQNTVASYVTGFTETDIAVPGETINQQLTHWNALPDYSTYRVVIIQIGLNDITGSGTAAAAIGRLQDYVDAVRNDVPITCRIYVSKMLPCKQRWTDLFGGPGGIVAQQQWQDINAAIAGTGSTPITNVDGRITAHVPLLDDGSGNLNPIYDMGDHIHENNAARQIIAAAWRDKLVADGLLA